MNVYISLGWSDPKELNCRNGSAARSKLEKFVAAISTWKIFKM
jgi:hypothetical protein